MKRDKENLHNDEDLQWLLDNPSPDSPGLFSKSPTWFRHSAYQIKEINNNLYICPCPGALYEAYKPFEKFPQIMSDFMTLLIGLDKVPKTFDNVKSDEHFKELCKIRQLDWANLLLEFVSKYGLFGIMYEYIESLDPCRIKNGKDDFDNLIVVLNKKAYSLFPHSNKILHSYTEEGISNSTPMMKYNDLCSYFLPNTMEPYPQIRDKQFKEYYSESVTDIYMNSNMHLLTRHIKKMNAFWVDNNNPLDEIPEYNPPEVRKLFPDQRWKWSNELRQTIGDVGLTFGYDIEANKWDLSWNFKSLISALSIMYMMNLTDKMGSHVHMCKYSKCDKIIMDRNCCCEKHDNAYRKAKERARKERENVTSSDI